MTVPTAIELGHVISVVVIAALSNSHSDIHRGRGRLAATTRVIFLCDVQAFNDDVLMCGVQTFFITLHCLLERHPRRHQRKDGRFQRVA